MALKQKEQKSGKTGLAAQTGGICDAMNFTAAEAYKMLRTKINLIIPQDTRVMVDEQGRKHTCKVIGVTSALRGEGKTTTSINLAYAIAEAGHKVLLLEGDMRLPNIAKRLGLEEAGGLSNIIAGQIALKDGLKRHVTKNKVSFYVISAGEIPPRPSELLESNRMDVMLQTVSKLFDYIIVDLPPVTVVTDALVLEKKLDGMLLVVRQKHCDSNSLRDALYQFEQTDAKVIGVVFNCSDGLSGRGSYYSYNRKYYRKYYKRGGGYGIEGTPK